MNTEERLPAPNGVSPFERIRRTNAAGAEYWSSRDFAQVLGYSDYRNFEQAMKKAKTACFNSGQQVDDHFGEITEMVEIGRRRNVKGVRAAPKSSEVSGAVEDGDTRPNTGQVQLLSDGDSFNRL